MEVDSKLLPLNQVILGDCREVLKTFPSNNVNLALTDPPYGVSQPDVGIIKRDFKNKHLSVNLNFGKWDHFGKGIDGDQAYLNWLFDCMESIDRVLSDEAVLVTCIADRYLSYLRHFLLYQLHFNVAETFTWHKPNAAPRVLKKGLISSNEYLLVGYKGKKFTFNNSNYAETLNYVECPVESGVKRVHPTQKPLRLMERFVRLFSNKGDIVLDPFCGSGSTCVAAAKLGRNFIGIDNDPEYVRIAHERLSTFVNGSSLNSAVECFT